jgi:hypothetical protein
LIVIIYINKDTNILISNYNNLPDNSNLPDVLSNPYSPPLRNDSYLVPVSTNSVNTNYSQIGILTPLHP